MKLSLVLYVSILLLYSLSAEAGFFSNEESCFKDYVVTAKDNKIAGILKQQCVLLYNGKREIYLDSVAKCVLNSDLNQAKNSMGVNILVEACKNKFSQYEKCIPFPLKLAQQKSTGVLFYQNRNTGDWQELKDEQILRNERCEELVYNKERNEFSRR